MTYRICVITQSQAFAASAGMRIRYDRFREGAVGQDVTITARPIDAVIGKPFDQDVYLFCKTFTPEALVLAARLRNEGHIVGQDFFDDYFSQETDQRLFQYRAWLRQMARMTDFAICTTPQMRTVLQSYMPHCPITIVEDPVIAYDPARVAILTDRKITRAQGTRHLRIAWFGIGDNPFFPVGLDDLTAPAVLTALGRLQASGWRISLTIATNLRALDVAGLARLRALPVAMELIEWTEAQERALLIDSDIALLPVSGQDFSRAKSLNRALTAMEQGCQILSIGEPLYAPLNAFLYRSVVDLDTDYRSGQLRLRKETVTDLDERLRSIANVYVSAAAFIAAARGAQTDALAKSGPPALLHGRTTSIELHKLVGNGHGLSICTPYTRKRWNFDVRFDLEADRLHVRALPHLVERYELPTLGAEADTEQEGAVFQTLDLHALGFADNLSLLAVHDDLLCDLATYSQVMATLGQIVQRLFVEHVLLLVDSTPTLPAVCGITG